MNAMAYPDGPTLLAIAIFIVLFALPFLAMEIRERRERRRRCMAHRR